MAGLFDDFKKHAEALNKDMKHLDKTYSNPLGFFGSLSRSSSANAVLKNELEVVMNMRKNIDQQLLEMEESLNDKCQLLTQVENITEDMSSITTLLGECGFVFFEENNEPEENIEENSDEIEVNKFTENVKICSSAKEAVDDDLCNERVNPVKIGDNTEQILEFNEKYLEANNLDLEDIVTPYSRKSVCLRKT